MSAGRWRLVESVWAAGLLVGCSLGEPTICTGIVCSSALVVELDGAVPSNYTIEARGPSETRRFTCTEASLCHEAVFEDFTPTQVTIEVTWAEGSTVQVLTPMYETVQPNGPDCPPVCLIAVVTITIPAPQSMPMDGGR